MTNQEFVKNILNLIAKDDLAKAISGLKDLLDNTPLLNEVLHQSGRFENIRKHIRLGTVSHEEANLTQNQIRAGLIELVSEIEKQSKIPAMYTEVERAISNSKNVVINSSIAAGGEVHIGDKTIHLESETSKWLRLFLYLFVPLLALGIAYLWYRSQPVTLIVAIKYQALHSDLAYSKGTISLYHDGKIDVRAIENETAFTGIQRDEPVRLQFIAEGFLTVDTTLVPSNNPVLLAIQRDESFAILSGIITDETTSKPIENVRVSIPCCQITTDVSGKFEFRIPVEYQRKEQRLDIIKDGYEPKSLISQVIKGELARINLRKIH